MEIHRTIVGSHLKIHSFNKQAPGDRTKPAPTAIILVCHGLYSDAITEKVRLPKGVKFAAKHGHPNDQIDYQWFQSIIDCGVASAVEYDFKVFEETGETWNYYLGKGEPDKKKGTSARELMSYDKNDRLPHPNFYSARNISEVTVLSSAYVENIMRYAESKKLTDSFDFATVTRSCRCLQDVLDSFATIENSYDHLLFAFCREFLD